MKIHWNVQQGSLDWHKLRRGIPTASGAHRIITPGKQQDAAARKRYLCELVAQRLLNWQAESIEMLEHVARGKAHEKDAAFAFELANSVETKPVGFVTTDDGRFGASPDRLIVADMTPLEIKCPSDVVQLEYLFFGLGNDYRCQVQAQIMTLEAERAAFHAYNVNIPQNFTVWTPRDNGFIANLAGAIARFVDDLDAMTEQARAWGVYAEYEWRTAAEREYGPGVRRDPLTTEQELAAIIEHDMRHDELHRAGA